MPSALSATDIANLALGKLGAERISNIDVPTTVRERTMRPIFSARRDALLRAHKWHFAKRWVRLTKLADDDADHPTKPYRYQLPAETLRPLRAPGDTWEVARAGQLRWDGNGTLQVQIIERVAESNFDPLFVDVLACSMALEACETITQSNTKKQDLAAMLKQAMADARRMNAFEAEDEAESDVGYAWIDARLI